jgi:hypothetical protein
MSTAPVAQRKRRRVMVYFMIEFLACGCRIGYDGEMKVATTPPIQATAF